MSEAYCGRPDRDATVHETRAATALGAAEWIGFAAAPTFAIMALLTGVASGSRLEMLCSAAHHASPLSGMVPMYLLMSAFHSTPWLKLLPGRRDDAPGHGRVD